MNSFSLLIDEHILKLSDSIAVDKIGG